MSFEYKMTQIPPNVSVQAKSHKGNEAAAYMQSVVNAEATEGWEFYRVDSIGVEVQPGCLAGLMGQKAQGSVYHVITFRRPKP